MENTIKHNPQKVAMPGKVARTSYQPEPINYVTNLFLAPDDRSLAWLKDDVKRLDFMGFTRMTKPELIDIVSNINFKSRIKKAGLVNLLNAESSAVPEVLLTTTFENDTINKFYANVSSYNSPNIDYLWDEAKKIILTKIGKLLGRGQKIRMSIEAEFYKIDSDSSIMSRLRGSKNNSAAIILPSTDLLQLLMEHIENIRNKISEFTSNGSGWILVKFFIELYKYVPLKGRTYLPTPAKLAA